LLLPPLPCNAAAMQRFDLQLQPGDIIVTGSDGLWDNIFAEEAATIASKCRDKGETATTAAQVLCRWAVAAATALLWWLVAYTDKCCAGGQQLQLHCCGAQPACIYQTLNAVAHCCRDASF
jgi:hypothetical protein